MASLVRAVEEAQSMVMARLNPVPILDPYGGGGAHAHGGDEGVHEGGKNADAGEDARMDGACVRVWDVDAELCDVYEDESEVAEWLGAGQLSPDPFRAPCLSLVRPSPLLQDVSLSSHSGPPPHSQTRSSPAT